VGGGRSGRVGKGAVRVARVIGGAIGQFERYECGRILVLVNYDRVQIFSSG
jgi:hypothetical protein